MNKQDQHITELEAEIKELKINNIEIFEWSKKCEEENKILKEFVDKLDEEFGKNVEPTLSEKADNIIALHRTNKRYCEIADEKIKELKQQLEEKDKELLEFKKNKLYFELLITRLQWLHKKADEYKEEKERFGMDEEISLSSVWDVLSLQKNNVCEYEEMCELQEGIECIANSQLLKDIEHDLQIKATRKEDEIFKDIEELDGELQDRLGLENADEFEPPTGIIGGKRSSYGGTKLV